MPALNDNDAYGDCEKCNAFSTRLLFSNNSWQCQKCINNAFNSKVVMNASYGKEPLMPALKCSACMKDKDTFIEGWAADIVVPSGKVYIRVRYCSECVALMVRALDEKYKNTPTLEPESNVWSTATDDSD